MSRFPRSPALLVVVLATFAAACDVGAPPTSRGVLLITVDTLRADHVGAYGAHVATPAMDGLAARGTLWEQVFAATPVTLPSHASILTGLDAPTHGVRHNGLFRLDDRFETLAETLTAHGYRTAAFTGAFVLDARYGLDQGFEHYDDALEEDGRKHPAGTFVERDAGAVVARARAWLDGLEPGAPFFAWVHLYDPHAPYDPPAPWRERFAADPYAGEVGWTDDRIGALLAGLDELDRTGSTLVVLTSDHGEGLGEHDEATHGDLVYDATMRVPLILAGPGVGVARRVEEGVASHADVVPTVLGLLGLPAGDRRFDGIDLLRDAPAPDRAVHGETLAPLLDYGWSPLHALRTRDTKYIEAPSPEFYDLAVDPGETDNRVEDDPRATALADELARRRAAVPDDLDVLRSTRTPDDDERRRLSSLGYVAAGVPAHVGLEDPKAMMGLWRRMREAADLARAGETESAVDAIEAILREQPTSAKAWYTAAGIYERAGLAGRVEGALREAVALQPRAEGWVALARYALARGDEAGFHEALREAATLDPNEGGVPIGLGHWHAAHGRVDEAREAFRRAISIDPVRSGDHAREQLARLDAATGDP